MEANILRSVKKVLNLGAGYDAFDEDVTTYINSAFANLAQMGVGPVDGFSLEDGGENWDAFIATGEEDDGNKSLLDLAKTYVILVAKMGFDPPTVGFAIDLRKEQLREYEWRLSEWREEDIYVADDDS